MLQTKDYRRFRVGDVEFEGAQLAGKALPGDTVILEDRKVSGILRRAEHKQIVGTLELASKMRYGLTSRAHPIFLFTPFSESYPPFYVGCARKDLSRNVIASIDFNNWDDGTCPRGNLVHIFGTAGSLDVEEEALTFHSSPFRWKKLEDLVEPELLVPQVDGVTFHIDPPGCRDIDDAITLYKLNGVETKVSIHIADVASWLRLNPSLIKTAKAISQTLYMDGIAIRPMFPIELSEGKFSLLPGEYRRVVTLSFIWDTIRKKMDTPLWKIEMIRVSKSFTYDSVASSIFAKDLTEICSGIAGREVTDSHEWIEQLMILYNCHAATMLHSAGLGVLRRHAGMYKERFESYKALGLPADRLAMVAGEYCEATANDFSHWGLQKPVYCHATSPIRRWSDCVNQIILQDIIENRTSNITDLHDDILYMNIRSKAVKAYERDLLFLRAILNPVKKVLDGVIAEAGRVWIPVWGRVVKTNTKNIESGANVRIKYYCDPTKHSWKRRLVLDVTRYT